MQQTTEEHDGQARAQAGFAARMAQLPMQSAHQFVHKRVKSRTERLDMALDLMQRSGHGTPDSYPWIFQQLRLAGFAPRPLHFMPWAMATLALFPACMALTWAGLYLAYVCALVYGILAQSVYYSPLDMAPLAMGAAMLWALLIRTEAKALNLPEWQDL